jgi:hypothetical protein
MMNDLETVGNAQISTSVKKFGTGSMAFDGTGDYLRTNGLAVGAGDFTVECWIYPSSLSGSNQGVFSVGTTDVAEAFAIYTTATGTINLYASNNERINSSAGVIATGNWYHVALTRSGTTIKLFLNGTQVGSSYTSSQNFSSTTINVGWGYGGFVQFNGYIDDLRITKGYARYTSNFTPPTAAFPNQ